MSDFYGSDSDDEEEDEGEQEDGEESELEPPPLPSKRKRPAESSTGPTSAPKKKRVAPDLQKAAKGIGLRSKYALPNPGIKEPTPVSKRR